jgi:hypothetical protein
MTDPVVSLTFFGAIVGIVAFFTVPYFGESSITIVTVAHESVFLKKAIQVVDREHIRK